MPTLFNFRKYCFFFWSAEEGEPVHVHVAERRPTRNATKFWLTADGGCILANNNSDIPKKDLLVLAKTVTAMHGFFCKAWVEYFGDDSLKFYK